METQPSLDHLARELRRRGLPPEYIARYVAELNDHITDLIEEGKSGMSKDALNKDALTAAQIAVRIGDPTTLADAASIEFARRSFCGRHPVVTFLLAPMPLAVLAWALTFAACFALLAAIVTAAEWFGAGPDFGETAAFWPVAAWVFPALFVLSIMAPPAVLTVLLCRLASRNGLSWRWSLAGCLVVALVTGIFQANFEADRLTFGFGMWYVPPVRQWLQFALPLTIGLWLVWRQTHPHTGGSHAPPDAILANRQAA